MDKLVNLTTQDGVAVITINNPPVNAISPGVPEGLVAALNDAEKDSSTRAIVIIGGGRTFIAGADIKELELAASGRGSGPPKFHDILARIEDSTKPVVMAIHGTALGGGLEIAMAGHYRVAVPEAMVGQPEVNLGIIPGAEGTQRLPRLVGVAAAVDLCVSGKPIRAPEALKLGVIDRVIEGDLLAGAVAFARELADKGGTLRKTRELSDKLGSEFVDASIFAAGRDQARKTRRNMLAALKVVDAIEAAATLPFDEGCKKEREIFEECIASDQARALIHAFFAERAVAKIPDIPKETAVYSIRQAAIIGAGTMGGGIAMACANAGISVRLKEVEQAALDRGLATIRKNYENSVKKGRFSQEVMDQRMALIHPQLTYEGFEQADLIIEAAFESMELKQIIFGEIDKIAKTECLLASNTSTLDIDAIASVTARPAMVIGLHFFSPANVMRLVEIVRGKATSKEVVATALALGKKLGKVGVVVGNCWGFVGNRMMLPYMREAQFLVEEGATPEQVDRALTNFGMAMGIFAVDDMGGIDVQWRVREERKHLEKPGLRAPLMLEKLFHSGRLGQKTGAGWYRYDENRKAIPDPEVHALIEKTAAEGGVARRHISDDEIIERCLYIMINEGAKILEEGYALRAADIDVIYLTGYGFPGYRGGPMWYADTVGLKKVRDRIVEFHAQHGEFWDPAPLLNRLADSGETFAAWDASREHVLAAV
ncbi:MAG TPA: 3-hydroxyacyl-CoA dehydrogenase NAD-binding domain-containing protein [Bryobacteraceae bacterium]|nr:3-hydroxyacyl-CoA dehydrogenase NAD-binding domain-containing protein [Bryobacteraceae bacterium]